MKNRTTTSLDSDIEFEEIDMDGTFFKIRESSPNGTEVVWLDINAAGVCLEALLEFLAEHAEESLESFLRGLILKALTRGRERG